MTEFIIAGGPFMWPLLACSILIITITVERLWFLQIRLVSPNGLTNQIVNLFNKNLINNQQADEIAELSSLGFLLVSCIKYKDLPRENLESKIEEKAIEVKIFSGKKFKYVRNYSNYKSIIRSSRNCYWDDYSFYGFK